MHRRYRCVPTNNLLETLQVGHILKWSRERSREASACIAFSVGKLVFLFVLSLLFACDQGGEVERLTATAEESEKAGQLQVVTALYHRAAAIRPQDFAITYRSILPDLPVGTCIEAAAHVRQIRVVRPAFAPAHLTLNMAVRQNDKHAEGSTIGIRMRVNTSHWSTTTANTSDTGRDGSRQLFTFTEG